MKTYKRLGFAVVSVVVMVMIVLFCAWLVLPVKAATIASQTFVLPSSSSVTHSANTYIILYDLATGNLVNATTGVLAAANAWGDCDIATAVHAENGLVYTATIPALDNGYDYGMAIFDAAAPAKTDVPTIGPLCYDPFTNKTFTDTTPVKNRKVWTQ